MAVVAVVTVVAVVAMVAVVLVVAVRVVFWYYRSLYVISIDLYNKLIKT